MAFDFPSSPTTGQTYSVTGGPTYVYNGTAWVVLTPGNQFNRTIFTATAGQTTFTMNYVVGAIDVYRNGVKLAPDDFIATNGTSIVLANGCTVGDTVEVISYPMITYSDAVKRTGDTMTGNLTVPLLTANSGVVTLDNSSQYKVLEFDHGGVRKANIAYDNTNNWLDINAEAASSQLLLKTAGVERMRIDASGRVTLPYQPAFTVYKDNGTAYSALGIVVFNNVVLNRGNHYNSSTGRFTAPISGVYAFGFYAHTETVNASARIVSFRKNGSTVVELYVLPNNSREQVGKQILIQMSANDTFEIQNDLSESWWAGNTSGMMFTGQLIG